MIIMTVQIWQARINFYKWKPSSETISATESTMASYLLHHVIFFSTLLFIFLSPTTFAQISFRPKALVLPTAKDASTLQYVATINQRTPLVPVKVVVDLGGQFMWVNCDKGYVSSSYRTVRCRSAACSLAHSSTCASCFAGPKPGCNNDTCSAFPGNTAAHTNTIGELAQDVFSINSTNGSNPGRAVTVPRFVFVCGTTFLVEGLAKGAVGMAGLGRTKIALPSQFAAAFSFRRKFAVCLSSGTGVVIFGDGPYVFLPGIEISRLTYTPLFINPVSTGGVSFQSETSTEYFIGVSGIIINNKPVPLNQTLLKIDDKGVGGTKISTVDPYTVLETSIYNAVVSAFVRETAAKRVKAVAPFGACFSSKGVGSTRLGPAVPAIDLVLQNKDVVWSIFGANSVVSVGNDVMCLGFVDGGVNPRTSIVIGGYQLEDNLIQLDLAASKLGFSSTLLGRRTTCANFNFTSTV